MNSATTTKDDAAARIRENLRVMADAKYTEADMRQYISDIEGRDPSEFLGRGGMGRSLGLAARGAVQGLGNLTDLNPFTAPQRIANRIVGAPQPPTGSTTADQLGLPGPLTSAERVGVSAAEGAATALPIGGPLGGTMLRGAANVALGAGASTAGASAKEAGVGPLGQMAASLAVGAGVPIVSMLGPQIIRAALTGTAARREAARQSLAIIQAGNPDAPVTLGQVVGKGGFGRSLEGGLSRTPTGAPVYERALDAQAQTMKDRTLGIAGRLGQGGTPETAGRAVQRGIEFGFIPRFRAMSDQLYSRVWSLVPASTPVIPGHTIGVFAQQGRLAATARPFSDNLVSPTINRWAEDLATALQANPNGIPLETLKAFRSKLGNMLSGADVVEDVALSDVKRLYGALSDDLGAAIGKANPAALPAWQRAQAHWKAGSERLESVLQPLLDKKVPERAFTALFSGGKDGATVLRSTMRSLKPAEKQLVAATVLRRLGKANPSSQDDLGEVFSADTYLTRWNQLAPEAKTALFDGVNPTITRDLNILAKAASIQREARKVFHNPGGTAANSAFWSILRGLPFAGYGIATGQPVVAMAGAAPAVAAAGINLTARAFTNPRIVSWLTRTTKAPAGAIAQELAILNKQSKDWAPEDRDLADELARTLGNIDWGRVSLATMVADATRRTSDNADAWAQVKSDVRTLAGQH